MPKALQLTDPRQIKTLEAYRDPISPTFGNLYRSALVAGFNDSYSRNLSEKRPSWLTDSIADDVKRVQRAEKNLDRYLALEIKLNSKKDIDIARLQADVSKFILKNLARRKYSEDSKAEPPSNVQINIINYHNKRPEAPSAGPVIHEAERVDPSTD